ncbi:MAG: hypothetical protein OXR62_11065 [Ahrensia sp.]|nr:hypothetical protein [Ahrensia sp.]
MHHLAPDHDETFRLGVPLDERFDRFTDLVDKTGLQAFVNLQSHKLFGVSYTSPLTADQRDQLMESCKRFLVESALGISRIA